MVQLINAKYIGLTSIFNIDLFFPYVCQHEYTYIHTGHILGYSYWNTGWVFLSLPLVFLTSQWLSAWEKSLCIDKFRIFFITKKAEKLREKVLLANERVNGIQWRDIKKKNKHYKIRLYTKIRSTLLKPLFSTLSRCMAQTVLNPHNITIWM